MKFRESNVFSRICVSFCLHGGPHGALDLIGALGLPGPDPCPGPHALDIRHGTPYGGHYWRPVHTCLLEDPTPVLTSGGH